MDIEHISIENFKGIKKLKIDFSKHPHGRFYTLVGLNESGKTTILEAINNFCYGPERMEGLELDDVGQVTPENMIPIAQRSNFNGTVKIEIKVSFSKMDIISLKVYLAHEHETLKIDNLSESASVTYTFKFKDSTHIPEEPSRIWDFYINGRQGREKNIRHYEAETEIWQDAVKFLSASFPDIVYFPNFLFDFPDRIYLDSDGNETDKFYRKLLQDILDSLGSGCLIETHILERLKNYNEGENERNLRAVLVEMERKLTETVFTSWNNIFGGNTDDKKIHVRCGEENNETDPQKGKYYMEFRLEDANGECSISERSLGFRWFFVFRLLTYFRGHRNSRRGNKKVLFLLDEPASNLHPTAQSALLECLEDLPKECQLIYTTHSHHLINPKWLENAYIIKNMGMDYKDTDPNYSAKQTNVTATRYRDFVGQSPEETCYFKPILDVLDYAPSKLEFVDGGVLVEGKNDYYVLNYMKDCLELTGLNFSLIPGQGCTGMNPLIQLYTGWGKDFCILLDSDPAGTSSKVTYEKEWEAIVLNRVFTYSDISGDFAGNALESMFTVKDKEKIYENIGQPQNDNKKAFNRESTLKRVGANG